MAAAVITSALRVPPLPRVGLGSAEGPPSEAMAAAVAAAVGAGVGLVDTAQNYGSEAAIGDGLRRCDPAAARFLLCKVDLCSRGREDPRARMRRQAARSRAALGVDSVDCLALHWPIPLDAPVSAADARSIRADAWRELEALVDEGYAKSLGLSNFDSDGIDEILAIARVKPILDEIELSPYCGQDDLLAHCAGRGLAAVAYSPYGTCWIAKYFPDFVPWAASSALVDPAVAAVAAEAGLTPAQACLAWARSKGASPIPKSLRPARIRETARCLEDGLLTAAQIAKLDALRDPRRGVRASLEAHARIIASPAYAWDPT